VQTIGMSRTSESRVSRRDRRTQGEGVPKRIGACLQQRGAHHSAFIATAFAQVDFEPGRPQWWKVADQLRPLSPACSFLDVAESDTDDKPSGCRQLICPAWPASALPPRLRYARDTNQQHNPREL
jgi:hypothetical protein